MNGTFEDEAISRGVAYTNMGKAYAGMGIAMGDVNNDGLLDLYVTHLGAETNNLWMQGPRGQFRDRTVDFGLTGTKWRGTGWGTQFADFNNDGWLDLAIANGRVFRGGDAQDTGMGYWETYAEKNQLLRNDGTGKFVDVSAREPGVLRLLERRPRPPSARTSTTTADWTCSSVRSAAGLGSSATLRPTAVTG